MAEIKKIVILGSTGSIGESALKVVDSNFDEFDVVAISASGTKIARLKEQCIKYKPKYVLLESVAAIDEISREFADITVLDTASGHDFIAENEKIDVVVVGTVGLAGLKPTFAIAKCTKIMAIANKETIIYGGDIMLEHLKKHGCKLIPVDSEHNSLYQLMNKTNVDEIKKLIITASGGSFRDFDGDLSQVTVEQALAHPKWQMGNKCTIDAANLVNKGIELIEASILFNMPIEKIEAVIHPQVIIHAMVEMQDNSVFAFLSNPGMSLHLANAMRDNNKKIDVVEPIDFLKLGVLEFKQIDEERFPGVKIARQVVKAGRCHTIAFNSADEILVEAFVNKKIKFTQITDILQQVLSKTNEQKITTLDDIIEYDKEVKSIVVKLLN